MNLFAASAGLEFASIHNTSVAISLRVIGKLDAPYCPDRFSSLAISPIPWRTSCERPLEHEVVGRRKLGPGSSDG